MADDEEVVIAACNILLSICISAALTISESNKKKHKTWFVPSVYILPTIGNSFRLAVKHHR